jgi:putative transposase
MNLNLNQRKTIRTQGFNYRSNGSYFVTFCTQNRLCLFGKILSGDLHLNGSGIMVYEEINSVATRFIGITIDTFVVMPNHVHAIIVINNDVGLGLGLPDIVRNIKTYTTKSYIYGVYHQNWTPFVSRLWQRGYHEHIIRNKNSLEKIRRYIAENPANWNEDLNFTSDS